MNELIGFVAGALAIAFVVLVAVTIVSILIWIVVSIWRQI
jgi:hypothetical protein